MGSLLRKIMLVLLFITVAYSVLLACEALRERYPNGSSAILGKPLEYNGNTGTQIPLARFWIRTQPVDNDRLEVNPQLPRDCFVAGFLSAFAVLGVRWTMEPRGHLAQAVAGTSLARAYGMAAWTQAVLVSGIAGTFLVAVHLYAVTKPPHAETTTRYQTASICLVGLIAAVGSFPRRSPERPLAAAIALLVWAGFLAHSFVVPTPADWQEDVWATRFPVYCQVAFVLCGWFVSEYYRSRRPAPAWGRRAGVCATGPWAILLGCLAFFVPVNYFPPTSAVLRQLICIDRVEGAILWSTSCAAPGIVAGRWATAPGTLATPTPTTDGQYVYAHFGGVGAYCVDFSGRVVWNYDDPVPPPMHQAGSSPVLWQDLLLLTYDVDQRSFTVALDKATGKVRWQADRTPWIKPMNYYLLDAYSTPIVVQRGGRSQLVHDSNFYVCAYDLPTGREIWNLRTRGGQIVASPVAWKDLIIVPGGASNKGLLAVHWPEEGASVQPSQVWTTTRHVPEIASPLVYGGYLYAVTPTGVATCREPGSNRIIWKERLGGPCHASLAAGDGKIYICDLQGVTSVVAAGPAFRLLRRNALAEPVQASFAIAGGHIFIRGEKHLFCIGL